MCFLKNKDPDHPKTFNLKLMHIINIIAISLFILAILLKIFVLD